ncbi:MAG TPA: hypothetical protein VFU34_09830 [Gaiellaceae bacterium]|nr:hypothetical protein [Gaiellaceae bacterium]
MSLSVAIRVVVVVVVLAWILGPDELRKTVPLLLVFALALGLEVQFLVGALRGGSRRVPDRSPQPIDRDRYGFDREPEELVVVVEGDAETWLAVSEGTDSNELEHDEPFVPEGRARSPVSGFLVGIGVLAVLAGVVWVVESRTGWSSLDGDARLSAVERYSGEASRIAGKPVSIACDESRDYVGYVQHADGVAIVGGDRAYITPEICLTLYRLVFEDDVRGSQTARAIAVLAHEAWHLRGESDEGTTECYALQTGVELGRRLGLDEGTARRMMAQQLAENTLRGVESLEYRVSGECREGGRLDLDPDGGAFP